MIGRQRLGVGHVQRRADPTARDVLATGGTLVAAHQLAATLGITVVGTSVLMELEALGGRQVVGDVHAVFTA